MQLLSAKAYVLTTLLLGDNHGLGIIRYISDVTDDQIVLHQGSIYPALKKLERDGLIDMVEEEIADGRGGRPRKIYSLTERGRQEAEEMVRGIRVFMRVAWEAAGLSTDATSS